MSYFVRFKLKTKRYKYTNKKDTNYTYYVQLYELYNYSLMLKTAAIDILIKLLLYYQNYVCFI